MNKIALRLKRKTSGVYLGSFPILCEAIHNSLILVKIYL